MHNAPAEITDAVMREYARPLAELFARHRSVNSIAHRLTARVDDALRHSSWRMRGAVQDLTGVVQVTPGRLEVAAVVSLARDAGAHVEAFAFTLALDDGLRIVALEAAGVRVR